MKLSPIINRLKEKTVTRFGNRVAGAAELALAMEYTLLEESMFVIQLAEECNENQNDGGLQQTLYERFAVVVALKNDAEQTQKLGVATHDSLFEIRKQIWKSILDYDLNYATGSTRYLSNIYYRGGRLITINRAWMWYQFEFESKAVVQNFHSDNPDETDGVDIDRSTLADLNSIYTDIIIGPSTDLPYTGDLPVPTATPHIETYIDLVTPPWAGAFDRNFSNEFKIYDFNIRRSGI